MKCSRAVGCSIGIPLRPSRPLREALPGPSFRGSFSGFLALRGPCDLAWGINGCRNVQSLAPLQWAAQHTARMGAAETTDIDDDSGLDADAANRYKAAQTYD